MRSCVAAKRTTCRRRLRSTFPSTTCFPACCSCSGYLAAIATEDSTRIKGALRRPFLFPALAHLPLAHLSFKDRDRLHVRGVGKHVDHARADQPVAERVHQH